MMCDDCSHAEHCRHGIRMRYEEDNIASSLNRMWALSRIAHTSTACPEPSDHSLDRRSCEQLPGRRGLES